MFWLDVMVSRHLLTRVDVHDFFWLTFDDLFSWMTLLQEELLLLDTFFTTSRAKWDFKTFTFVSLTERQLWMLTMIDLLCARWSKRVPGIPSGK